MISFAKSTLVLFASSKRWANLQQSFQDWIRREIIDDDPYDALTQDSATLAPLQVQSSESSL